MANIIMRREIAWHRDNHAFFLSVSSRRILKKNKNILKTRSELLAKQRVRSSVAAWCEVLQN